MHPQTLWLKLRKHLVVVAIPIAISILVGVAVFTVIAYRRAASELIIERDQQVTYLSASRLKDELSKFSDTLFTLARTQDIFSSNVDSKRSALHQFQQRLAVFDGGVVLLDNFGRVQATEPERPNSLGQDWSNHDFFHNMLDSSSVTFSNAYQDGLTGAMVVAISVPITDEKDEFAGALVGIFRLGQSTVSSFYASIVRLRLGQSGDTYVIDENGKILYDSAFNHVGESVDSLGLTQSDLASQAGASRIRNAKGHDVILAHALIPGTSWTLVTEDDWAILTRSTKGYINTLIVLLILGMVLPAFGVLMLIRQQNRKMQEHEWSEHEKRVVRNIQQTLLPKHAPILPGWQIAYAYQPTKGVVGDFYNYKFLADGRLMITIGDVKDTGIAATVVMSTLRATLHGAAYRLLSPVEALECSNDLLCPDMLPGKSASCLYSILEPSTGLLMLANAGHCSPYYGAVNGIIDLNTSGIPLGLRLDSSYEQFETTIKPGEWVLFYSDGLIEAQNRQGDIFGHERVKNILSNSYGGAQEMIDRLLFELHEFTGNQAELSDDITLLVLQRLLEK